MDGMVQEGMASPLPELSLFLFPLCLDAIFSNLYNENVPFFSSFRFVCQENLLFGMSGSLQSSPTNSCP